MELIKSLSDDQAENASTIVRHAKEIGVNPQLAVALAYQESRLRTPDKPGAAGEIGIMQIKPATAEMVGFSPKDINTLDGNIRAGLTYLKTGLDKFNNDPIMAAAGYNAGYSHPFFSDPTKELPDSTKNYLKSIRDFGGFAEVEAEKPVAPKPQDSKVSEEDFAAFKARAAVDAAAAGIGAAGAKGLQAGKDVVGGARAITELARQATQGGLPGGGLVAGRPPLPGDASSGAKWLQNWGNIQKPGFTGGVPEAAAQYQKMQPGSSIMKNLAKRGLITPTPVQPGVFTGGQLSISSRVPQTPPVGGMPAAQPAGPGALSKIAGGVKTGMGAITRSPIASGALGGLSAAESAQEFQRRYQAKDYPGMALAGLGAAGGLLSMVPHPATRGVGMATSAASPLALYLLDKSRTSTPPKQMQFDSMPAMMAP